jgi:starch phosphorylase
MADIEGGMFGDKEYFKPLVDSISNMKVGNDWFLVANDFASYLEAQEEVDRVSGASQQQRGDVMHVSSILL